MASKIRRCIRQGAVFLMAGSMANAQSSLNGKVTGSGSMVINPPYSYTSIYVVFPPQAGTNRNNFMTNVIKQDAIAGVTLKVPWNVIETLAPTTTPCTPLGTDTCQQDPVATTYYHSYDWTTFDNNGATNPCTDTRTNRSSQWFCDFQNGSGSGYKKVGLQLFGIGDTPDNQVTPEYVTNDFWLTATGGAQHYVNTINAGCGSYDGSTPVPSQSLFWEGHGTTTVTVHWHNPENIPLVVGDYIWVKGVDGGSITGFDVTGVAGAKVTSVITGSSGSFDYTSTGTAPATFVSGNPLTQSMIAAFQSWPVPYDTSYSSAWQAFLQAAIYHYNHLNNVINNLPSWYLNQTLNQIAYIRPGVARGGEAIPLCTNSAPMHGTGSANFTQAKWKTWYGNVNDIVQGSSPQMQIMYSLNAGDPQAQDSSYTVDQATIVIAHRSATGAHNGFGSQGLKQADTSFVVASCPDSTSAPDTGNNWGCMFLKYWSGATHSEYNTTLDSVIPTTTFLELQQIDCSNPTGDYDHTTAEKCFQGGGAGKTGDLRTLFPFTTGKHVSIIEIYTEDAMLAFDPLYCKLSGSACDVSGTTTGDSFTKLSATTQYDFFQGNGIVTGVGIGNSCGALYHVAPQGTANGDCSYAQHVVDAHGPH